MLTARRSEHADREGAKRPSPSRRLAFVLVVLLMLGLFVGRFLFAEPEVAALPPVTASTTAEQIASLEQRVAGQPFDLVSWQTLGLTLVQAAVEIGDPAYYRRAEEAFAEATALDPANPQTAIGRAVLALARHDFQIAVDIGGDVNAADPFNSEALLVMVDAEIELGRYEAAASHLQELLDLRPALPALTRTSYLRELYGDLPGAEQAIVQALTAGSRSRFDLGVTTTLLGDLYLKQGDLERAAEQYSRATEFVPDLLTTAVGQARVAIARGELSEAATLLEQVVDRFPEPGALVLLGDVLTVLGRDVEAGRAYATVSVIADLQEEAGADVDLEMARFEADHGVAGRAVELARAAYRDRPTVFGAETLAWALHRAGRSEEALDYARESLRLGTLDAALLSHTAVIFEANGNSARAAELQGLASALDPWFRVLHPELLG